MDMRLGTQTASSGDEGVMGGEGSRFVTGIMVAVETRLWFLAARLGSW